MHHLKCSQSYARYWSNNFMAPNKFKMEDILQKMNNLFPSDSGQ